MIPEFPEVQEVQWILIWTRKNSPTQIQLVFSNMDRICPQNIQLDLELRDKADIFMKVRNLEGKITTCNIFTNDILKFCFWIRVTHSACRMGQEVQGRILDFPPQENIILLSVRGIGLLRKKGLVKLSFLYPNQYFLQHTTGETN